MKDDDFDFTRSKGHTDSYGTGPGYDHTTLTSSGNHNVYVEQPLKECSILFVEQIHKVIFENMVIF